VQFWHDHEHDSSRHYHTTLALAEPIDRESTGEWIAPRDPAARDRYLHAALAYIPRLLGAIDRNPYRPTYGCLDRQFWHYRTSAFPSEMYQEGALPLALVATTRLPGNRWRGQPRVQQLAVAATRYAARSCHRDGSCDDYYPFERALGAAAFSFTAATEACRLLGLNDAELLVWLRRRADWLIRHDESGRLANHQALVALGLARFARLTDDVKYAQAAEARVERVLSWQSPEGWFEEYGGADPGYQTVTIDCLAKYQRLAAPTNPARQRGSGGRPLAAVSGVAPSLARRLDESLKRAVAFARLFLHPDGSYGGPYGSRGTYHFYPHGMELLAGEYADASDLADGFLCALATGRQAYFDDDRMFAHRLGNLIEAYLDWSPQRTVPRHAEEAPDASGSSLTPALALVGRGGYEMPATGKTVWLPQAGLLVRRTPLEHTVISAARGGVFKHFSGSRSPVTDAGLVVELADGRLAVSQQHAAGQLAREVCCDCENGEPRLSITGPLHFVRWETATPLKQALLHVATCAVGRFCRTAVRWFLQRRLITGRREAPLWLARTFEWGDDRDTVRVTDTIELTSSRVTVRRMSFGTDHEAAYVAATGVYQESVLGPWTDLADYVAELNERRRVTIVREW
jgi:hypothetical protein